MNNEMIIICYKNGNCQISYPAANKESENPLILETHLTIHCCHVSHCHNYLAIVGQKSKDMQKNKQDAPIKTSDPILIHIYCTMIGKLLNVITILDSGKDSISGISWHSSSNYLAFIIADNVYIYRIRHSYLWSYMSQTGMLAYCWQVAKQEGPEHPTRALSHTTQNYRMTFCDIEAHKFLTAVKDYDLNEAIGERDNYFQLSICSNHDTTVLAIHNISSSKEYSDTEKCL
ncbi:WD repeat-containing protein 35-like [Gordionus sp. m RMFG-2023]|uniref:WD repeat-containing protein 35-like n=1 Tax=Gordionus sp. m RMFG-2023 TaxID=3053472 RepID=UPI0031FCA282